MCSLVGCVLGTLNVNVNVNDDDDFLLLCYSDPQDGGTRCSPGYEDTQYHSTGKHNRIFSVLSEKHEIWTLKYLHHIFSLFVCIAIYLFVWCLCVCTVVCLYDVCVFVLLFVCMMSMYLYCCLFVWCLCICPVVCLSVRDLRECSTLDISPLISFSPLSPPFDNRWTHIVSKQIQNNDIKYSEHMIFFQANCSYIQNLLLVFKFKFVSISFTQPTNF